MTHHTFTWILSSKKEYIILHCSGQMTGISPLTAASEQFMQNNVSLLASLVVMHCTGHWMFRGKKWLIARFQLGKCLQFFVSYKVSKVPGAHWPIRSGEGLWLADWRPPLRFWNSNIFWKLVKTPDIIDDYFNAIPWSFIFLSPLPWTRKKLAFVQSCEILGDGSIRVIWVIWLRVPTGRWVLIPAHISSARDYNEN